MVPSNGVIHRFVAEIIKDAAPREGRGPAEIGASGSLSYAVISLGYTVILAPCAEQRARVMDRLDRAARCTFGRGPSGWSGGRVR